MGATKWKEKLHNFKCHDINRNRSTQFGKLILLKMHGKHIKFTFLYSLYTWIIIDDWISIVDVLYLCPLSSPGILWVHTGLVWLPVFTFLFHFWVLCFHVSQSLVHRLLSKFHLCLVMIRLHLLTSSLFPPTISLLPVTCAAGPHSTWGLIYQVCIKHRHSTNFAMWPGNQSFNQCKHILGSTWPGRIKKLSYVG